MCERDVHLVAGINERGGHALYDAAVVIGPSGHVGTFRKVHLPHPARPARHVHLLRRMVPRALSALRAPESGHRLHPPTGCPSPARTRTARRWPTSSVWRPPMRTRSSSPRRPGRVERGQPFVGQRLIVGYTGRPIAGSASPRRKASIGDRIAAPSLGFPVGAPGAAPNGHLALMHSRSCRAILGALGIVPRRART